MKRLFTIWLIIVLIPIIGFSGYKIYRSIMYPYSVPVDVNAAYSRNIGSDPVTVTLHQYKPTRADRYNTTGKSISFTFPADMYFYKNNQKGGAQWDMTLYLDYYSFEPMWPKRWELENLLPDMDLYSKTSKRLDGRKTSVSVSSNISSVGSIYYSSVLEGEYIDDGEYCGLTIYRDEKEPIISDPKYRDIYPFDKEGHFYTAIEEQYKKMNIYEAIKQLKTEDHFYAYCSALNSHTSCSARTNFEGWSLNYHLPKKDLCNWKKVRSRMRDFLSNHVVSRTPLRTAE